MPVPIVAGARARRAYSFFNSPGLPFLFDSVLAPSRVAVQASARAASPPARVFYQNQKDAFVVVAHLPGVGRDQVEVSVEAGQLRIASEVTPSAPEGYRVLRRERQADAPSWTIKLPQDVDQDRVSARLNGGRLEIQIPKVAAPTPRRVPVTAS